MYREKVGEKIKGRKLRLEGQSIRQITSRIGVSKSSVSLWVRDIELTRRQKDALKEREKMGGLKGRQRIRKINLQRRRKTLPPKPPRWPKREVEIFFNMWSAETAYVLGYFAADGSMYINSRNSKYVSFTSTDRTLLEMTKDLMKAQNRIEIYIPSNNKWETRFSLQIGSKKLFMRLKQLGFNCKKSLVMDFPEVPKGLLPHFIRGYFDGDGHVHFGYYKMKNRARVVKRFQLGFTSGSLRFLQVLQVLLRDQAGVGTGSLHPHGRNWKLSYGMNDTGQLYKFMYPTSTVPCLKRKRESFECGIKKSF